MIRIRENHLQVTRIDTIMIGFACSFFRLECTIQRDCSISWNLQRWSTSMQLWPFERDTRFFCQDSSISSRRTPINLLKNYWTWSSAIFPRGWGWWSTDAMKAAAARSSSGCLTTSLSGTCCQENLEMLSWTDAIHHVQSWGRNRLCDWLMYIIQCKLFWSHQLMFSWFRL